MRMCFSAFAHAHESSTYVHIDALSGARLYYVPLILDYFTKSLFGNEIEYLINQYERLSAAGRFGPPCSFADPSIEDLESQIMRW